VKKWITCTVSWRYSCSRREHQLTSKEKSYDPHKFGHALMSAFTPTLLAA
jgi:hypothetical protein